jgi:PKD repeat protein
MCACGDDPAPPTTPTQPTPAPPTVGGGSILRLPTETGLVLATVFAFTAVGFSASDNSALSYTWDFGDGIRQSAGPTVTHTYQGRGVFTVSVTAATQAGASASATLGGVSVTTVDGRWGLRDQTGTLLMGNTSLSQNGTNVSGDDTRLNCRYSVSGAVLAQRSIALVYTRPATDCQGLNLPVNLGFTGTADNIVGSFSGALTTGGTATLFACSRPGC